MNRLVRAIARYWFVLPVLLGTIALQFVFGFGGTPPAAVSQVSSATPLLRPTFTPTFPATFPPPPPLPPSVPNTPVIVAPTVSLPSSATPGLTATIPAFFSTPVPPPAVIAQSNSLPATPSPLPTTRLASTQSVSPLATPASTVSISPTLTVTTTSTPLVILETPTPTVSPTLKPLPTPHQPTPNALASQVISVPILMYHYLSAPPPGADIYRLDLSISPEQFDGHLAYLKAAGYETISLRQLAFALAQGTPLPPQPVVITFDDGYRDNYDNAFPLLKKYGFTATFFVFTQVIDEYNVDYLTWEMVQEMHQAGMEFGSHSYRHPDLRGRDRDFLVYEILGSKEAIEQRIGEPVRFFAYPAGRYDAQTIEVLNSADFWGAVTTQWGAAHTFANRYELQRLRIRGNDSAEVVAAKLKLVE